MLKLLIVQFNGRVVDVFTDQSHSNALPEKPTKMALETLMKWGNGK